LANSGIGITINGGTVNFNKDFGANSVNANLTTVNSNATLVMLNPTGTQMGSIASLTLGGGTVELNGDSETISVLTFNSGILRNSAANTTSTVNPTRGVSLVGTNCIMDITNDATLAIAGAITNSGWLVKTGAGLLTLMTNNTFSGRTLIAAGTLALSQTGSISNSAVVAIGTNAVLDVMQQTNQTLTLNAGQTLTGNGSLGGNVATMPGSLLAPGVGVGALTISNSLALGGNLLLEVNKGVSPAGGLCVVLGSLANNGTGTVTVTNLGSALAAGDSFKVFNQPLVNGQALAIVPEPGPGLSWENRLAVDGSIAVVGGVVRPVITSLTPTNGLVAGSTTVTIIGSGFAANPTVTFGGLNASITSAGANSIVVVTPSHSRGSVDVIVTNPDLQSATLPNGFAYVVPATATNLTRTVASASVTFSWPADYLGWILQTNGVNVAASNYWGDVPGSLQTNQMTFSTKNAGLPLQFFRLRHP
jgi:autotransporter-associated beta strand protein